MAVISSTFASVVYFISSSVILRFLQAHIAAATELEESATIIKVNFLCSAVLLLFVILRQVIFGPNNLNLNFREHQEDILIYSCSKVFITFCFLKCTIYDGCIWIFWLVCLSALKSFMGEGSVRVRGLSLSRNRLMVIRILVHIILSLFMILYVSTYWNNWPELKETPIWFLIRLDLLSLSIDWINNVLLAYLYFFYKDNSSSCYFPLSEYSAIITSSHRILSRSEMVFSFGYIMFCDGLGLSLLHILAYNLIHIYYKQSKERLLEIVNIYKLASFLDQMFLTEKHPYSTDICCVCLDPLYISKVLPCSHTIHKTCLWQLIRQKPASQQTAQNRNTNPATNLRGDNRLQEDTNRDVATNTVGSESAAEGLEPQPSRGTGTATAEAPSSQRRHSASTPYVPDQEPSRSPAPAPPTAPSSSGMVYHEAFKYCNIHALCPICRHHIF